MKKLFFCSLLVVSFNAFPSIEHIEGKEPKVSETEISRNRACFQDLEKQGCGDPAEDPKQFRSCLNNVFPVLSKDCKALMTKLYKGN